MPKETFTPSPVEFILSQAQKAAPSYVQTPQDQGRWALLTYAKIQERVLEGDIEAGAPFSRAFRKKLMDSARTVSPEWVKIDNYGEAMGILLTYNRAISSVSSLDMPVGDEGSMGLGELIPDKVSKTPEEVVIQSSLKETLSELVGSVLTERQARAIELMFEQGKTQAEMGEAMGIGRGGAYSLKRKALSELRKAIERSGLEKKLREHLT